MNDEETSWTKKGFMTVQERHRFAEIIARKRKACGWSQQYVADRLGIPLEELQAWERGPSEVARFMSRLIPKGEG